MNPPCYTVSGQIFMIGVTKQVFCMEYPVKTVLCKRALVTETSKRIDESLNKCFVWNTLLKQCYVSEHS